jgi:hypothetical protein
MNKAVKKVRVESTDLVVGMFVCDLDRPWLDSPFLIQGFYIKDNLDVDTVCDVCDYVFVDKVVGREQRLRPTVLVLLDGTKNPTRGGQYIVLEETTHSDDGSKLDIVKNLEPNAFGIDRAAIKLSF